MRRSPSLLDGPHAYAWDRILRGDRPEAIQRPTARELHLCSCGQTQTYCPPCAVWFCDAPGHIKHTHPGVTR